MSGRSRKKKQRAPRQIGPAAPTSSKRPPLGRNGTYFLVAVCFALGIGGGAWMRHRLSHSELPPTAEREMAAPERPDNTETRSADTPAPDSDPSSGASATATTNAGPFQPPRDPAARARIEKEFGRVFRRGYANFNAERYAAAAQDFLESVEIAPYEVAGHHYLGQVYAKMMLNDKAEQAHRTALQQAHEQQMDFPPSQRELCKLLHDRGAYQEANGILLEMQEKTPKDPFVLAELGINYLGLGEAEKAAELLQAYNQLGGQQSWGSAQLGRAYELMNDPIRAEAQYREAIRLDPYLGVAHHWLGLLLARQGREAESRTAIDRFDKILKLQTLEHDLNMALLRNDKDVKAIVRLAQVRRALGRHEQALQTLNRARQLIPHSADLERLYQQWSQNAPTPR